MGGCQITNMNQIILAFITGITNGGITCSITQGGLLATAVSKSQNKYKDTYQFLIAKIIIHTILGFIFGLIGSAFNISLSLQGYLQILIGIFMVATSFRLLGISRLFDFTEISIPKFLSKTVDDIYAKYPKYKSYIIGASTIFIPCGATQAMFVLSIGSGNPINGALIMLAFVLGTTPLFFLIGITIGKFFQSNLLAKIATLSILTLGIISINNGMILRGSNHTLQNYFYVLTGSKSISGSLAKEINGTQEVNIIVTNSGYKADQKLLKINTPVKLNLKSENIVTCVKNFVIPSLGITKNLPSDGLETVEFTPNKLGILTFSCGMGMYTGSFEVVN